MSETTIPPALEVHLPEPLTKFEREQRAFHRLLPELLKTHHGQYVAIHDEQVVDSGADQLEVALRVWKRIGPTAINVTLVRREPRPACRSGVIRDLNRWQGVQ
jgi:hypothetical protein